MTPARGAIRLTRTAIFSLSAVGLAVAAHAGGGEPVNLVVALLCVPAVMLVVNLLAGRRRGPAALVLAMSGTQFALHTALMAAEMAGSCRMTAQHLASGAHASTLSGCSPGMSGHQTSDLFAMSPRMLAAHALSATLLALLLARGEAAIWALAGCLGFRLTLPHLPAPPPARSPLPVLVREALLPRAVVPRRTVRRRGPPKPVLLQAL